MNNQIWKHVLRPVKKADYRYKHLRRLGLADVLRYCREHTSMPSMARRIRWGEGGQPAETV